MGDDIVCFMDRAERENHMKLKEDEGIVDEKYEPSSASEECRDEPIPNLAQVVMKAKRSNFTVK